MADINIFLDTKKKKTPDMDMPDVKGGLDLASMHTEAKPKPNPTKSWLAAGYGMIHDAERFVVEDKANKANKDAAQKEAVKKAPRQKKYENQR